MTQIAHIRGGAVIRRFTLDGEGRARGRVTDAAGAVIAMPPVAGFSKGDDKVVPVETAEDDQSSTGLTATAVVTTVEAARVLDTTVITDVTPTDAMVNAERDRRIEAGKSFTVTGYGSAIPLTGRQRDQIVYMQRLSLAQQMIAGADTTTTMVLRDGGDVNRHLTAPQMAELIGQAIAWVEAVMQVSWDMKDAAGDFPAGIPADFADDLYWP